MRVLLADNDADLGYENSDEQLSAALLASFMLGTWPAGYDLSGSTVTPDPLVRDFGIIVLESVWAMVVGTQGAYAFRTRALSETDMGQRKRDLMQYAREKLYSVRDGDAVFSTRQTLIAFLNSVNGLGDLATVTVTPPAINIAIGSDSVSIG